MLYDLSKLRELSDNDEAFIIDMLQTFKHTAPPILQRMVEYSAMQKFEAAGREAHKMIPGVSFLGATKLQNLLISIEEHAKSNKGSDTIPALVSEAVNMAGELISCFEQDFPGLI